MEKGQLLGATGMIRKRSKALALYALKAEDMTQVEALKIIEQQNANEAVRRNLKKSGAASTYEKKHAILQEKVDAAKIEIAAQELFEQDVDQYEQNQAVVEKTRIVCIVFRDGGRAAATPG